MTSSTKFNSSDEQNSSARESFTEIQPKILALAGARIWPNSHAGDINVKHLRGGSLNRIFGLTLTHDQNVDQVVVDGQTLEAGSPKAPVDYILRVPRFKSSHVDADVAVTLFVQRLPMVKNQDIEIPKITVPKIILFDDSKNNEIKASFMVQNRLRGQNLSYIYNQLGHEQQRRVAQDLGLAYRRMLAVYSTQAGMIVLPDDNKTLDAEIHVRASEPYAKLLASDNPPKIRGSSPYHAGRADESVYEFLT